jgi:hypothetical protein
MLLSTPYMRNVITKALLATAFFAVAAVLLAITRGDPGGRVFVRLIIEVPLLLVLAAFTAVIICAIATFAASLTRLPRTAPIAAAVLGWLAAGGGYQSFGGLGSYSDLIQPAFAIAMALPWLIGTAQDGQAAATKGR